MAGNAQNLRIGDADIYLDEQYIGYTLGGIDLNFEREFTDLTADQHGTSPLDMALTGNNLTVVVRFAEVTRQNLSRALPEGRYDVNGLTDSKVGFGRDSGYKLSQNAKVLRMHPRAVDVNDRSEDVYIWKAVSSETVELAYRIDEQRVLETTFRALIDTTQPDGTRLGRVGDQDIS